MFFTGPILYGQYIYFVTPLPNGTVTRFLAQLSAPIPSMWARGALMVAKSLACNALDGKLY